MLNNALKSDYIGKKKYLIEEMDVKYVIEYISNNFS